MTQTDLPRDTAPGAARSTGPTVQSLLATDTGTVPAPLREESYEYLGSADIDKDRYLTQEFHQREVDKLWKKVWQFACREEDIPEPGDYVVYEVADISLVVVRTPGGGIKAYHNACLHRGRRLCDTDGHAQQLRCPYHGMTWTLDGELAAVPCRWDFPHIEDTKFGLPQVQTGVWAGFVFVNPDPDAGSLADFIGDVDKHFEPYGLADRFKAVHVAKVLDCNWKIGMEAFLEAYHVIATHPQLLEYLGDANTQYDIYQRSDGLPGFNRMITPQATTSPHLDPLEPQDVLDAMFRDFYPEGVGNIEVPEGQSARSVVANTLRAKLAETTGADLSGTSDSEIVDAIQYFVFPNLVPWAGAGAPLVYRFRPYGNDPDRCIFDILLLTPLPAGVPKPKAPPVHWLGPDEDFSAAPELGSLSAVFNQDLGNLPHVQRGLKAMTKPGVTLANYQEIRIRQFHRDLDEFLAR